MLLRTFPLLTGLFQETTPRDIPMPSGTVLLLIFFALVFVVAWRLIVNRSEPAIHAEPHAGAHTEHDVEVASRASGIDLSAAVPEDLTLIEGIGPKINQILHEKGIHTFAELAETSPEFLSALLREHRIPGTPITWPEQARLAALGDWDGLKTLQQNLTAGRRA